MFSPLGQPENPAPASERYASIRQMERRFGTGLVLCKEVEGRLQPVQLGPGLEQLRLRLELAGIVLISSEPEIFCDESPLLLLALPFREPSDGPCVAVGAFVSRRVDSVEQVRAAARWLGVAAEVAMEWINRQPIFTADSLLRLARVVVAEQESRERAERLGHEVERLALRLAALYDEQAFLNLAIEWLTIADRSRAIQTALDNLVQRLPVKEAALLIESNGTGSTPTDGKAEWIGSKDRTLPDFTFEALVKQLLPEPSVASEMQHHEITVRVMNAPGWRGQVVLAPLVQRAEFRSWLALVSVLPEQQFGAAETALLNRLLPLFAVLASR